MMMKSFLLLVGLAAVAAYPVTYDKQYMVVDGKRKFYIGGDVHYARLAEGDWPAVLDRAVAGGINLIQTYLFWSVHEPVRGQYNFDGNANLVKFIQLCKERNLPVYLRVGPYINAEFNLGGVPSWLLDIEGMKMRTNNDLWKGEMTKWLNFVLGKLKDAKMFAPDGGPIIVAQMENEYGYQNKGTQSDMDYQEWYQDYALSLGIDIPWSICATPTTKAGILKTANFWDCPSHANATFENQPAICTEYWGSWPMNWGSPHPLRPAANNAFSTARFFARGGGIIVYYPFAGGNNFDRMSGGAITANMATTYDFDGPLDEWNLPNEPKYSHLAKLHHLLLDNMEFIVSQDNVTVEILDHNSTVGNDTSLTVASVYYWGKPNGKCFALLENGGLETKTIVWNGVSHTLPAWSMSVLTSCTTEVYNTANVVNPPSLAPVAGSAVSGWKAKTEVGGVWGTPVVQAYPANQLRITHDTTDYLWYVAEVDMPQAQAAYVTVSWGGGDTLGGIYVNGRPACVPAENFACQANLTFGVNKIAVLAETIGLPSFPIGADTQASLAKGISGVQVNGQGLGAPWFHMAGMQGEAEAWFANAAASSNWTDVSSATATTPITWYSAMVDAPEGDAVALDLAGMNKGIVFVNGHNLGRYWLKTAPEGLCNLPCDYRGPYARNQLGMPTDGAFAFCNDRCGEPSQRYYVVPTSYLTGDRKSNHVVLFEERGSGSLAGVRFVSRSAN